jgi:Tfp pilus assembly protein PilZ
MKRRPLSLTIIGLCYILLAPPLYLWALSYFREWPLLGPRGVIPNMNWMDWVMLCALPAVGAGIVLVKRWGYYLFFGYTGLLILQNGYEYFSSQDYSTYASLLGLLLNVSVVGYFVQKHVAAPFFNPAMRWWERQPRYLVNLMAQVRVRFDVFQCRVRDIALTGCFIETDEAVFVGDPTWVKIQLGDHEFTALGKVIWIHSKGIRGVGVQFVGMGKQDRKNLRKMIEYLAASNPNGLKINAGVPNQKSA